MPKINIEELFNIDNDSKSYLLGLLVTDGYIFTNKTTSGFSILLKETDGYLLHNINKSLNFNKNIFTKLYNNRKYNILNVTNKLMAEKLKYHNITQKKSLNCRISINIPKEYIGGYIRGILDGDGCVYFKKRTDKCKGYHQTIKISSGSIDFVKDLQLLLKNYNITSTYRKENSKNRYGTNPVYSLLISQLDYKKLYDLIYPKDMECFLLRKNSIFRDILKHQETYRNKHQYITKKLSDEILTKEFIIEEFIVKNRKACDICKEINITKTTFIRDCKKLNKFLFH